MKKRVFTLAGVAMVGCRAVLGIEDLPGDGGGSSSGASSSGSTSGDSGGKDGAPGFDAGDGAVKGDAGCSGAGQVADCIKCCRDDFQGNMQFDNLVRGSQCICGAGSPCAGQCGGASGFCDGGDPKTVGMTCFACSDPQLLQNVADCSKTLDDLAGVADLGKCFKSCKQ